ncbi:hypothetical protein ACX0MV_07855 [Pseudomonas borbori]
MASLEGLFNTDFSYPGIEIKVELLVMQEYLKQIEVGINAVCTSYLDNEIIKYAESEYYEYQHIYSIAEGEIPRAIKLPLVVSIYTIFENSITQLLSYAQGKEQKGLSIKDINDRFLTAKFNKYMKHVLEFDFQISEHSIKDINALSKVRNCIAHANGNLPAMSKDKIDELKKLERSGAGIELTSLRIDVSYDFLNKYMASVEKIVKELMDYLETRYDFN